MPNITFSMNGFRRNLISEMDELKSVIEDIFESLDAEEKEDLIDKFDTVACSINSLNSVCINGDENFSDMSNSPEIDLLGDYTS